MFHQGRPRTLQPGCCILLNSRLEVSRESIQEIERLLACSDISV